MVIFTHDFMLRDMPPFIANSSGLGSMSLCYHNISKDSHHHLTLLPLTAIVKDFKNNRHCVDQGMPINVRL